MQIRKILGYYWPHIKKYKWSFIMPFIFYGIATIINNVLTPVIYKSIIDIVTEAFDRASAAPELLDVMWVLLAAAVAANVLYRLGDYVLVFGQSKVLKLIADDSFARLGTHSQKFFSDTFGGSLVAKVKRFTDSFETLHDTVVYSIWMNSLVMLGIFASLLWFAPTLAGVFIIWLILFVLVTAILTKYQIKKDLAHAESQSETK